MDGASDKQPRPLAFLGLVLVLSVPFWVLGSLYRVEILPGLPVTAAMVLVPALLAVALAALEGRVGKLFHTIFDPGTEGSRIWLVFAILFNPLVFIAMFLVLQWLHPEMPLPAASWSGVILLFGLFVVAALLEELGWTAYVTAALQTRFGFWPAALLIGAVWSIWHYPALLQADRDIAWIAWWTLWTMSMRAVMVHIFNRTGQGGFAVLLFHAMTNLSWQVLPVDGSYFDPMLAGLGTAGLGLGVAVIVRGAK